MCFRMRFHCYLILPYFCFWNICVQTLEISNDCGTLTLVEPVLLHKRVTFIFSPDKDNKGLVKWYKKQNDFSMRLDDPTRYYTYSFANGSKYALAILQTRDDDKKYYYVNHGECAGPSVFLKLKELDGCGMVYLRTQLFREGENVEIGYIPSAAVSNHPDQYVRTWVHYSGNCREPDGCIVHLPSGGYDEKAMAYNDEYVLWLYKVQKSVEGSYAIQCTENTTNRMVTNAVAIQVPVQPSNLTLGPVQDSVDCTQCIFGYIHNEIYIKCHIQGITQLPYVHFSIDGVKMEGYLNNQAFIVAKSLNENDHLKNVTCEVDNSAITSPISVTTKLYVKVVPPNPTLRINPKQIQEGIPLDISCISVGGRPAPEEVDIYVAGNKSGSTTVNKYDKRTGTYTRIAKLIHVRREWNGQAIECCLVYILTSRICSEWKPTLNYIYSPKAVVITSPALLTDEIPFQMINLTCDVIDANPACAVKWNVSGLRVITEGNETNSKITVTPNNGFTTSSTVTVNVSAADVGTEIKCSAVCPNNFSASSVQILSLEECGSLHLRTKTFREGGDVEIGYIPPPFIRNYPSRYVRQWIHYPNNRSESNVSVIQLQPGIYEEMIMAHNHEYVLTLHDIQQDMQGEYKIRCTENRTKDLFTDSIIIMMPPGESKFEFIGTNENLNSTATWMVIGTLSFWLIIIGITVTTVAIRRRRALSEKEDEKDTTVAIYTQKSVNGIEEEKVTGSECAYVTVNLGNQTSNNRSSTTDKVTHIDELDCLQDCEL